MDPDERLTVVVTDGRGRSTKAPGLAEWLKRAAPARARGEVTIALVSDARMRTLNKTYRGKDYATDVLSFPRDDAPRRQPSARKRRDKRSPFLPFQPFPPVQPSLGDIVIATGVARRQARDLGHSLAAELRILALHGLLHLLGYDHERDRGRMRTVEQRLLRRSGVRDGLIERARARGSPSSPRARRTTARPEPVEGRAPAR